jgi:hypothetical protein
MVRSRVRIRRQEVIAALVMLAIGCQPSGGGPSALSSELPSASPSASVSGSAEPTESPPATLLVRLTSEFLPPTLHLEVEIMSDGQVIEGGDEVSTRTLTASGLAQVEDEILSSPLLQDSAEHPWELAVTPEEAPIGLSGTWKYVIDEQPGTIVVTSGIWLDEAEAMYFVPSPERQELDRLAHLLADLSSWVTPEGWVEAEWAPYEATSYLLWVTVYPPPVPEGTVYGAEVIWPFDGSLEDFGDIVRRGVSETGEVVGRCGYLDASDMAGLVTTLTGLGFGPTVRIDVESQAHMDLASEANWVSLYLSAQTVGGFPTCADAAQSLPPY